MSSSNETINVSPINSLQMYGPDWAVRVRVVRRGSIDSYVSARSSGQIWKPILIDDEGTLVQTVLFNDEVDKFRDSLWKDESYIISNGQVAAIKKNFANVHDRIELKLTPTTLITPSEIPVTTPIPYKFISFKDAVLKGDNEIFDVFGVVISVSSRCTPKKGSSTVYKMKEVLLKDMSEEYMRVTLWGDLADFEGALLEGIFMENPIIALSKVKGSTYEEFSLKTLSLSSLQINPDNEECTKMRSWVHNIRETTDGCAFSSPIRRMNKSYETTLQDIVQCDISKSHGPFCSFTAIVMEVLNKDNLCYEACKGCSRRVGKKDEGARCGTCQTSLADISHKFRIKLKVCDEEEKQTAFVTLFDASEQLVGCQAAEFAKQTLENKYTCKFYKKLLKCAGNKYKMLTKLTKAKESEIQMGNIIVDEIEEVDDASSSADRVQNKRVRRQLVLDD